MRSYCGALDIHRPYLQSLYRVPVRGLVSFRDGVFPKAISDWPKPMEFHSQGT